MEESEARILARERADAAVHQYMSSPDSTVELVQCLHDKGMTYKSIAEGIGVTYMSIFRWARGLSQPRPARPVNEALMRMDALLEVNRRGDEIAKQRAEKAVL